MPDKANPGLARILISVLELLVTCRFSVYIVCPSGLRLNNSKLHKT